MIIAGPWALLDIIDHKIEYGVQVLPGYNGNHETIAGPDNWVVFDNGSRRAKAATDFLTWLTRPEQDARWTLGLGNLPIRKATTELPAYEKFIKDIPDIDVFTANLDNAKQARPHLPAYPEFSEKVGDAISEALVGGTPPQEALTAAATEAGTVLFVPGSVVLGLALALALNLKIPLIGFYRTCFFVPYVVSAAATGILANFVFDPDFGIVNAGLKAIGLPAMGFLQDPDQAMLTLVLISIWGGVGMPAVVYLAALQDIPRELVEAAKVDGGVGRHLLRHVVLPQLRPATVFLLIWQTITALQLFDLVYTTTKGQPLDSTTTIVFYLYRQAFQLFHSGYGTAIAYVLFLVTLAISGAVLWRSAR
ncbi:extracellular solute-binding protein [Nonomuraea diastatica]|uniref:Extracellular solute-binding protein n=2 Tax=Nonomuraea diastatica TaxID=1848329 RepID=A0A4V2YF88_9ACTN|nr:extracellular solute-binding protein [Nonomuraea diastatica]